MYPRGSHIRSARGSRGVGGRGENYPTTTDASATNRGSPPSYSGMPPQHRHHLPVAIHVEADRAAHPTASQPIRRSPIQISIPTSTELQTQAPPPHHHHQQQQQSAPISYARHTLPQVGSGCMYASSSLAHQGGTLPSCSSRESLARPATATPLHLAHSGSGSGDFHHVNSTISISSPITSSATIYISNLSTHIQNSHQLAPFVPHAGLTSLRVKRSLRHVDIGFAEYESVAAARDALRWFHTVGTLYHLVQHACASSDPSQSGFVPHWYVDLASMDGGRPPTPSGGGGPEDLADAATLQQLHELFLEKLPLPYKDEQVYLRLLMPNLRYFARFPVLRNAQPLITTWSRGTPTYRPTTVGKPATTTSSPITHTGDFIIHAESQTMAPMYSATATTTTTGATGGWMDPSQLPSSSSTVYQTSYSHTAHTPDSAMMMKMPTTTTTMEATSLHSPMLGIEPLHGGSPLTVPRQLSCGGAEIAMDGVVLDTTNLGGRRTLLLRQRYTRHVGDAPTRAESFPSFSSHLGDEFGLGPHMSDIDVISHVVQPTFFQQRFPNEFVGFRLFQDPPQSGGCFVMFTTHNIALRCMESLMRHPRLLEVFDISFADTELRHPQVCGSTSSPCWAAATSSATVGGGGAQGVGLVSSSNASRAISSSEEM